MIIGTIKEIKEGENRVALSPDVVKNLIKQGFECTIESGAGILSSFSDKAYLKAGAYILPSVSDICQKADVLVKPSWHKFSLFKNCQRDKV